VSESIAPFLTTALIIPSMAAPCSKWVSGRKGDQVSADDLATKGTGNIPTVMLWQMESDPNSNKALYFSKY
jgi:hypothetical protein